jgi:hypothetical protein
MYRRLQDVSDGYKKTIFRVLLSEKLFASIVCYTYESHTDKYRRSPVVRP